MPSSPIIQADTLARLKTRDPTAVTPSKNGTRKISLGLLSPPSSPSDLSRSVSSSSSAMIETKYITIPTHLESAATFEFLGFTSDTAAKLFERRELRQTTLKIDCCILEWASDWIIGCCGYGEEDSEDDWDAIMLNAGIKREIRNALAKPEHKTIRLTQPLREWLLDIIRTYYDVLEDMNARLLEDLQPSALRLRGGAGEEYTVPQMPGGHLALFKSVEFARCKGCISEDGTVDLTDLQSYGPTDFCQRGGLYFSHQMWVAKHYSALIRDACPVADRRTMELHVPLAHFKTAKTWELTFDDNDWKQLLFYSRRSQSYPKELARKRAQYGIIHGPVGHTHNKSFGKMSNWTDITEKHQLQEEESADDDEQTVLVKIGKQHAWIREESISQLGEDVKNKAYIRKPEQGFKLVPQPWMDESMKAA